MVKPTLNLKLGIDLRPADLFEQFARDAEQAEQDAELAKFTQCGEHDWQMTMLHPDDESPVELVCARCGSGFDVGYPDLIDLAYGEFTEPVAFTVEEGQHNYPVEDALPLTLPVNVDVKTIVYPATPDHGEEYDVEVTITPRTA